MRARVSYRNTLARMFRGEPEVVSFHDAISAAPKETSGDAPVEEIPGKEPRPTDTVEVVEDQGDEKDFGAAHASRRRRKGSDK